LTESLARLLFFSLPSGPIFTLAQPNSIKSRLIDSFSLFQSLMVKQFVISSNVNKSVSQESSTMNFKYHPVRADEEKFSQVFCDRSSTVDSLDSALRRIQNDSTSTDGSLSHHTNLKWIWLGQALLFLVSCAMFFSAIFIRTSTIKHVRDFSAYCMLVLFRTA
jgi:hypothetical protein